MAQAALANRPIFTNVEITDECPFAGRCARLDDVDDMFPVLRGLPTDGDYAAWWHFVPPFVGSVVVIDEADLYFDCRDFTTLGKDVGYVHKMLRKWKIDVIYLCQSLDNLYVRIRRLTQRFIVCEHNYATDRFIARLGVRWSRFLRSEFGHESLSDATHTADGYFTWREAAVMFPWFRTEQIIGSGRFDSGVSYGYGQSVGDSGRSQGIYRGGVGIPRQGTQHGTASGAVDCGAVRVGSFVDLSGLVVPEVLPQ
jgi:hypothetical protein